MTAATGAPQFLWPLVGSAALLVCALVWTILEQRARDNGDYDEVDR